MADKKETQGNGRDDKAFIVPVPVTNTIPQQLGTGGPAPGAKGLTKGGGDLGQAEVQARTDEAEEQGFYGVEVDPTPNENYTVEGVTAGKPTPETDAKTRTAADKAAGLDRSE